MTLIDAEDELEGDVDGTICRFDEFALPQPLLSAIEDLGFVSCTPIQAESLPYGLSDYDVTGQAQTGTGKTAAFLISIFTKMWENPLQEAPALGSPRALVLAPTRELALQIESDAVDLSKHMNLQLLSLVGGMDFEKQQKKLEKRAVDLVVATPGRLIDFIQRKQINLRGVETLVIDEADRMLDMLSLIHI